MIRLPLTSIFLSKADLEQHLHDIDIYQSLLKQGFEKKDVLQYFKNQERRKASDGFRDDSELDDLDDTVGLANKRLASPSSSFSGTIPEICSSHQLASDKGAFRSQGLGQMSGSQPMAATTPTVVSGTAQMIAIDTACPSPTMLLDIETKGGGASQSHPHAQMSRIYAPRQSSLLRFASKMSSDDEPDANCNDVVPGAASSAMTGLISPMIYPDKPMDTDQLSEKAMRQFERLTIHDFKKTDDKKPHGREDATSSSTSPQMEITLMPSDRSPSTHGESCSHEGTQHHILSHDIEFQSLSLDTTDEFPSSPSFAHLFSGDWDRSSASNPSRRYSFAHPYAEASRSDSDEDSNGGVDTHYLLNFDKTPALRLAGTSIGRDVPFTVYNDRLPVSAQPQTPADLRVRNHIDDRTISYTAPPGMMRYGSQIQEHESVPNHYEDGDLSPTVRAIDLRTRRNREFRRSATVEGLRLQRTYQARRNNADGDAHQARFENINTWRDDLDADRVGEENFDLDPNLFRVLGHGITRTIDDGNQGEQIDGRGEL